MRLQKSFDLIVLFLSLQSIIVAKREGDWTIFDLRVLFFSSEKIQAKHRRDYYRNKNWK